MCVRMSFMTTDHIINSLTELETLLNKHEIVTQDWQPTLQSLYKEIENSDCYLQSSENGALQRRVDVLRVRCFYTDPVTGNHFQLVEDRQVFSKDQSVVRRGFDFVAERRKYGEDLLEGAHRALEEELQIPAHTLDIRSEWYLDSTKGADQPSYKGLYSVYHFYNFSTQIPESEWRESYKEVLEDKTTYFVWIPLYSLSVTHK